MKKEAIIYIILGVLILITLLSFAYFLSVQEPLLGPTLAAFTPPLPANCSNTENITTLWDYIFHNKPSLNGIKIFPATTGNCNSPYGAINITSEAIDSNFYILYANPNTTLPGGQTYLLWAIHGNATPLYLTQLEDANLGNLLATISLLYNNALISAYITNRSTIISPAEANSNFSFFFNLTTPDLLQWTATASGAFTTYLFNDSLTITEEVKTTSGVVNANYSIEYFTFFKTILPPISQCTSNFTAINTSCRQDDTVITWYNDSNSCPNATLPANQTTDCDFNNNRIIGNNTHINDDNLEVEIYIDSNPLNLTKNYTETRKIEIREGNIIRVELDYDFSSPLNLKNIIIEKQTSSNFGYLIVGGLPYRKILRIDKLNSSSSEICVRDREVSDIDDFSSGCTSSVEIKLACPGNTTQFTCNLTSNIFEVSGLTRSAVKELVTTSPPPATCTSNWQCTSWSECTNNQQTRSCTDSNSCGTNTGKPVEAQACTSTPVCVPNWQCTGEWKPEKCPENEKQTQTCNDLNNCRTNAGKPAEERSCKYESQFTWITVIVILTIFIITVIIIIIYIIIGKQPRKHQDFLPSTPYTYNPKAPPSQASRPMPQTPQYQYQYQRRY